MFAPQSSILPPPRTDPMGKMPPSIGTVPNGAAQPFEPTTLVPSTPGTWQPEARTSASLRSSGVKPTFKESPPTSPSTFAPKNTFAPPSTTTRPYSEKATKADASPGNSIFEGVIEAVEEDIQYGVQQAVLATEVEYLLHKHPDIRDVHGRPVSRKGLMELPGGLPEGTRIAGFVEVKNRPHTQPLPRPKQPQPQVEIGIGRAFDSNAPLLPSPYIPVGPLAQLGLMPNVYPTTRPPWEVLTDHYGRVVSKHPPVWHDQLDLHELGHFKRQYRPLQDDYQRQYQVYDEFQDMYSPSAHPSQKHKHHYRGPIDRIAPLLQMVYPP